MFSFLVACNVDVFCLYYLKCWYVGANLVFLGSFSCFLNVFFHSLFLGIDSDRFFIHFISEVFFQEVVSLPQESMALKDAFSRFTWG